MSKWFTDIAMGIDAANVVTNLPTQIAKTKDAFAHFFGMNNDTFSSDADFQLRSGDDEIRDRLLEQLDNFAQVAHYRFRLPRERNPLLIYLSDST